MRFFVRAKNKIEVYGKKNPNLPFHPAVRAGDFVYLSGQVGKEYTVEQGYQAARECAFAQLNAAWTILGDLGRIKQAVIVLGMVNCADGFFDTPSVMHGFSDTLYEVLGEKGVHARSAVGMQALPGNGPVEVETIYEIEL